MRCLFRKHISPRIRAWISYHTRLIHYDDVIMTVISSQITGLTVVYSIVYSDAGRRKHQNSASLAFVRGIHRGPVNSPHKWPVTRKMFPFGDVIMIWGVITHPWSQFARRVGRSKLITGDRKRFRFIYCHTIQSDTSYHRNTIDHIIKTSKETHLIQNYLETNILHDDVIKWKLFRCY